MPFEATDESSLEDQIINAEPRLELLRDMGFSEQCIDLISKLLEKEKKLRPKACKALKHQWLQTSLEKSTLKKKGWKGAISRLNMAKKLRYLASSASPKNKATRNANSANRPRESSKFRRASQQP